MKKKANVQTTTITTQTTVTTTTEHIPASFMPINPINDIGAEDFYKENGISVRTMQKFGKNRIFAILPVEGYDEATDEEKAILTAEADAFTQSIDNYRRSTSRPAGRIAKHETISLDGLMDAGYDPSLDSIDVAIKISKTVTDSTEDDESVNDSEEPESNDTCTAPLDEEMDDYDYAGKKPVSHGRYDSFSDLNNPEYIVAKTVLYTKLHSIVNELKGEDLEIALAIMKGVSERELAKKLGVSRTTLQGHRAKLMSRFRAILGDDCIF